MFAARLVVLVCVVAIAASLKHDFSGGFSPMTPQLPWPWFGWQSGAQQPFGQFMFPFPNQPTPKPASKAPAPVQRPWSGMAPVGTTPEQLKTWCASNIKFASELHKSLLTGSRSLTEVLDVVNEIDITIGNTNMLVSLLSEVHPEESMRNQSIQCQQDTQLFTSALIVDSELYAALLKVDNSTADSTIADRRFHKLIRMLWRGGAGLTDETKRTEVRELNIELEKLSTQFSQNINADTRTLSIPVTDTKRLQGLPQEFIDSHKTDGNVVITTQAPDVTTVLKFAVDSTLRRDLYVLFQSRAVKQNMPILSEVLQKRHRLANLLGYKTFAHMATEDMMIRTPEHADSFTKDIASRTRELAEAELEDLSKAKLKANPNEDPKVQSYDVSHFTEQLMTERLGLSSAEVRKYFAFNATRQGLLGIVERLFDVVLRDPATPVTTWHKDVSVYDVFWTHDPKTRIGRIFLDMHPRQNKYSHAAQFPVRAGVDNYQVPEGALVCNFARDFLDHREVETFFHEFGHLLHHIIGGQNKKYAEFSGVATEWDFVEAPSQMFEEWAFDLDTLRSFATDSAGNKIPAEMVKKLSEARLFGRSEQTRQQMFYAQLSLQLHFQDPASFKVSDLARKLQAEFSPFPYVEGTEMVASFGHVMGYSSNYYTYMWSMALAQHMFKVFKTNGLTNKHTSLKYRDEVLMAGGSRPASVLVYNFVESEFNLDALIEYLTPPAQPQPSTQNTNPATPATKN